MSAPIFRLVAVAAVLAGMIAGCSRTDTRSPAVADQIRKIWADPRFKDLRPRFWFPSALGGSENTGSIQPIILGPDFNRVAALASQEAGKIRRIKGLLDVSAEINLNSPEFQVEIDRQRAADLGVQVSDVGTAVRLMIAGTDQVSTYKEGAEQYQVTMQLDRTVPESGSFPAHGGHE